MDRMASNNDQLSTSTDDKVATTITGSNPIVAEEEQAAPAGWMRLNPMNRSKKSRATRRGEPSNGKDLSNVTTTTSSLAGSGDYTAFRENGHQDGLLTSGNEGVKGVVVGDGRGGDGGAVGAPGGVVFKQYKRRWFGLVQMVLLNIIVSWDWLTFAASSTTSAEYFGVSTAAISWVATCFLFAFVVVSPFTIWTLHHHGPKTSIITASVLLLVGNWIRYGGTKANNFGVVIFGQILTGLAQPFVLASPTRYSDLWFSPGGFGRVTATALMSLANPLGGALGQLVNPFWANAPSDIPNMVLYVSIMSSVATIPSFFIPGTPPTPCSPSSAETKQPLLQSLHALFTLPEFYLIMIPFIVYVGLFNSISSLINNILYPYGFSQTDAGIAGALLIVVGLVAAAVISPVIDRTKGYLLSLKICVPITGLTYLAFIWAPPTRAVAAPYAILSVMGAASFCLLPVVLEFLCEITHPVSPEVTSTLCWSGGQLLGGLFIIISNALMDGADGGAGDRHAPFNYQRALWMQAAFALVVAPLPLALGLFGRGEKIKLLRLQADREASLRTGDSRVEGNGAGDEGVGAV